MHLDSRKLNRKIQLQRPITDGALDGAGSGDWQTASEVWAEVQDMLPSRGERLAEGINVASRPARVRIRYRNDVTASMRVLVGRNRKDAEGNLYWQTDRIAQIVSVPAELGNRDGLEFMIEDYSSAGNTA